MCKRCGRAPASRSGAIIDINMDEGMLMDGRRDERFSTTSAANQRFAECRS
jgi:hypothetical protein